MDKVRLIVASPRELSRESLAQLLKTRREFQILGTTDNQNVVRLVREIKPDIVLFDSQIEECGLRCSCWETLQSIKQVSTKTELVVLCEPRMWHRLSFAVSAGAKGFLSKNVSLQELVTAIMGVHAGELIIGAEFAQRFIDCSSIDKKDGQADSGVSAFGLSHREKDILMLLAKGAPNLQIANTLFISKHTVKVHVSHILEKMKVSTRQQAAMIALDTRENAD